MEDRQDLYNTGTDHDCSARQQLHMLPSTIFNSTTVNRVSIPAVALRPLSASPEDSILIITTSQIMPSTGCLMTMVACCWHWVGAQQKSKSSSWSLI